MELPARAVEALAKSKGVRWISVDAPVQSAGTASSCTPGTKVRYNAIASGQFYSTYYGYTDPWGGGEYNPANISVRYRYDSSASTHPSNIFGGDVYLTWSYTSFYRQWAVGRLERSGRRL